MPMRWIVAPGSTFRLAGVDPSSRSGAGSRAVAEAASEKMQTEIDELQQRLWAEGRQSLLVVLQGMDASGKDGAIRHVFRGVNPQGVRVTSFKEPSALEVRHDFLWRVHACAPAAGEIAVFNRSHYEDVLIARVDALTAPRIWRARYKLIRGFEETLAHSGTRIVKVFLHISPEEQAQRLAARRSDPTKRWKHNENDAEKAEQWSEYVAAYEEALSKTSTAHAPWFVVPADRKWYRNWAVNRILVHSLRDMNPQFPVS